MSDNQADARQAYEDYRERFHVSTAVEKAQRHTEDLIEYNDRLDTLEKLTSFKAVEHHACGYISGLVKRARQEGETWDAIGDALGVTRQSAWQSYAAEAGVPAGAD